MYCDPKMRRFHAESRSTLVLEEMTLVKIARLILKGRRRSVQNTPSADLSCQRRTARSIDHPLFIWAS